jgi:hypothetical protein
VGLYLKECKISSKNVLFLAWKNCRHFNLLTISPRKENFLEKNRVNEFKKKEDISHYLYPCYISLKNKDMFPGKANLGV